MYGEVFMAYFAAGALNISSFDMSTFVPKMLSDKSGNLDKQSQGVNTERTVHKMGLILRSIERMLKMQFSMSHNFTLQPLRRYDVKPPEKNRTSVILRLTRSAWRKQSAHAGLELFSSGLPDWYSSNAPRSHLRLRLF